MSSKTIIVLYTRNLFSLLIHQIDRLSLNKLKIVHEQRSFVEKANSCFGGNKTAAFNINIEDEWGEKEKKTISWRKTWLVVPPGMKA